jgi:hypothetical protein
LGSALTTRGLRGFSSSPSSLISAATLDPSSMLAANLKDADKPILGEKRKMFLNRLVKAKNHHNHAISK